jgi:uncharacterized phage protein (TIGR02220 family)
MVKLTKRKGFNFFRSYFDVYNELDNVQDKVEFIDALLNRQFLGVKPTELKGMAKFAYISQTNSIDSQVKGYEDKTKNILTPTVGVNKKDLTPSLQVEVEEKVEVEVQDVKDTKVSTSIDFDKLLIAFNDITNKNCRVVNSKTRAQLKARLKDGYTKQNIKDAIINCYNDKHHKESNHKYLTLEFITRPDKLERYSQAVVSSQIVTKGKGIGLKAGDFFEGTTLFVSFISEEGTAVWKNTKDML